MHYRQRLQICTDWYENQTVLTVTKDYFGKEITKTQPISRKPEEFSGVWGYGGDSVAIYFDNEPYPSSDVVEQNKHLVN